MLGVDHFFFWTFTISLRHLRDREEWLRCVKNCWGATATVAFERVEAVCPRIRQRCPFGKGMGIHQSHSTDDSCPNKRFARSHHEQLWPVSPPEQASEAARVNLEGLQSLPPSPPAHPPFVGDTPIPAGAFGAEPVAVGGGPLGRAQSPPVRQAAVCIDVEGGE